MLIWEPMNILDDSEIRPNSSAITILQRDYFHNLSGSRKKKLAARTWK